MLVCGTTAHDTILRVDELPTPESATQAKRIADGPGGCGANVAFALARLGHEPRLLSAVGTRFRGSSMEARLAEAGVQLDELVVDEDRPTARAVMTSEAAGRQTIVYHEGATPSMTELDPQPAPLGHFAPGELTAYPPLMEAVDRALYDPGQETFYRPIEEVAAPIDRCEILLVNEHEIDRIVEHTGPIGELLEGLEAVVVSDAGGQTIHTDEGEERLDAAPADPVDLTGAGDGHRAGVLYGLKAGWPLAEACRFGSVIAACVIEELGAQAGAPTLGRARERFEAAFGRPPPG